VIQIHTNGIFVFVDLLQRHKRSSEEAPYLPTPLRWRLLLLWLRRGS
jgi:hypothetical protein